MTRKLKYTAISKRLLTFGMAIGLLLSSGIAAAVGQIAAVTNDTVIETGEEFGFIVTLNGDGRYDVYVGITGGAFGTGFVAFDTNGVLLPWDPAGAPPKLMDNADLATLSIQEKIISLLPRMPLDGYAGDYVIYAALSTPGQFLQELQAGTLIIDGPITITVKEDAQ
jgi:hypothetical protein